MGTKAAGAQADFGLEFAPISHCRFIERNPGKKEFISGEGGEFRC
jgi:hypothetical protein